MLFTSRSLLLLASLLPAVGAACFFSSPVRAYDANESAYEVICNGFPPDTAGSTARRLYLRMERNPGGGSSAANAWTQTLAGRIALHLRAVFPQDRDFYMINWTVTGSSTIELQYAGSDTPLSCSSTEVAVGAAHNFVPVTDALATLNTSTAAVTTAVNALKSEVQGFRSDASSTFTDWNDFTGVDWVMVGYYFAVALSSVLGLWFVAMVCGQLIDLLRSAR